MGVTSPTYKHGRYSKLLPVRLQARYHEARSNPQLLSLRDDIAAAESRLGDLFQRVDTGESGHLWQALRTSLAAFNTAVAQNEQGTMRAHLATMQRLIEQGSDDSAAWAEIQALWETRCKLTLTEHKTLLTLAQMITNAQLQVLLGAVNDAIHRCVGAHTDTVTATAIMGALAVEFTRLSAHEAAQGR